MERKKIVLIRIADDIIYLYYPKTLIVKPVQSWDTGQYTIT